MTRLTAQIIYITLSQQSQWLFIYSTQLDIRKVPHNRPRLLNVNIIKGNLGPTFIFVKFLFKKKTDKVQMKHNLIASAIATKVLLA